MLLFVNINFSSPTYSLLLLFLYRVRLAYDTDSRDATVSCVRKVVHSVFLLKAQCLAAYHYRWPRMTLRAEVRTYTVPSSVLPPLRERFLFFFCSSFFGKQSTDGLCVFFFVLHMRRVQVKVSCTVRRSGFSARLREIQNTNVRTLF